MERTSHLPSRVGWDGSLALAPYGPRFREMRKLFQQMIGPREISKWHNLVEMNTTRMLMNIVKDPAGLSQYVREYVLDGSKGCEQWLITRISNAGAIILMITYGYQVKEHNDPLVKIAEDGVDTFSKATLPAAFLVDVFPFRTKTQFFTWCRTLTSLNSASLPRVVPRSRV